jgi:hypothetical protein
MEEIGNKMKEKQTIKKNNRRKINSKGNNEIESK